MQTGAAPCLQTSPRTLGIHPHCTDGTRHKQHTWSCVLTCTLSLASAIALKLTTHMLHANPQHLPLPHRWQRPRRCRPRCTAHQREPWVALHTGRCTKARAESAGCRCGQGTMAGSTADPKHVRAPMCRHVAEHAEELHGNLRLRAYSGAFVCGHVFCAAAPVWTVGVEAIRDTNLVKTCGDREFAWTFAT